MLVHPGIAITGEFAILTALMPNPSEYFGEVLFGVKIIPYSFVNALLLGIGTGDVLIGLGFFGT